MIEDPRIGLGAAALWRPGRLPCPPIHNQVQAERAAALVVDALAGAATVTVSHVAFADRLRDLRDRGGWSQQALATATGCTATAIRQWEHGTREPSGRLLVALASALDVRAEYLLAGRGPMRP